MTVLLGDGLAKKLTELYDLKLKKKVMLWTLLVPLPINFPSLMLIYKTYSVRSDLPALLNKTSVPGFDYD